MRIITNGDPNLRVACHPWDPNIMTSHSLTIPSTGWQSNDEVAMSSPGWKNTFEADCSVNVAYNVLWTQAASGGCWPFAVLVRETGADRATKPLATMGLAHLAYKRDGEAHEMGELFYGLSKPQPADVFLIVMLKKSLATDEDIRYVGSDAFAAFGAGFGARIPDNNCIVLKTNTVNAGISRLGYFGELSNEDVEGLKKYRDPMNRPCG